MAQPERSTEFHIVTTSKNRARAFEQLLGKDHVRQVMPRFTEDIIRKPINSQLSEWPMEMAETKAFQDIASHMVHSYLNGTIETGLVGDVHRDSKQVIRIYSDTINIAYTGETADDKTVILEKPKTIGSWLIDRERGAMALSGKYTELCTALTAIDMTDANVHPSTVLIRTAVKMKPFTREDIMAFIDRHGEESVLRSASGVSFVNETVELFDTKKPLRVYIQTDPNITPSLVTELPTWDHLTQEDRNRILYGAIPEAIQNLIAQFPRANPSNTGRPTARRYDAGIPMA